jgi:hypothetical protein
MSAADATRTEIVIAFRQSELRRFEKSAIRGPGNNGTELLGKDITPHPLADWDHGASVA